jgi:hypothetical protein
MLIYLCPLTCAINLSRQHTIMPLVKVRLHATWYFTGHKVEKLSKLNEPIYRNLLEDLGN